MAGALIITAEIGKADLAWLDKLRQAHYPAERNHLPAHLTMFHALPPSAEREARATPCPVRTGAVTRMTARLHVSNSHFTGAGAPFTLITLKVSRWAYPAILPSRRRAAPRTGDGRAHR